jgi:hypothetical protein
MPQLPTQFICVLHDLADHLFPFLIKGFLAAQILGVDFARFSYLAPEFSVNPLCKMGAELMQRVFGVPEFEQFLRNIDGMKPKNALL